MKQVDIKTRVIPNKPRSGNYPVGSTIVAGGGSGGSTTIVNQGGADLATLRQLFLSKKTDDTASGIITFLKGIKIASSLIRSLLKKDDKGEITDEAIMSALRIIKEIEDNNEYLKTIFLRKDQNDSTEYFLSLLGGAQIGKNLTFGEFITNVSGGIIDEKGIAELESLFLRSELIVPAIRYNFMTYFMGYNIISPGGGLKVKDFSDNGDGTWTVVPDLDPGIPCGQYVDDILTGFWYDKNADSGDFAGFRKMQFRVMSVDYDAKTFVMAPRPDTESVPYKELKLGQTGNFTNENRQTYIVIDTRDGSNCITLFEHANTWDPEPAQMPAWFGKKKGMTVQGINADNYSAVLQNIIMTGLIFQIDEITGESVRVPLWKGDWVKGKYGYYNEVSHNGSRYLCVNPDGTEQEPGTGSDWLVTVKKGEDGKDGEALNPRGRWEASQVPYYKNDLVSFTYGSFVALRETNEPPYPIAKYKNGNYRRKKDGGYILAGASKNMTLNPDWQMVTAPDTNASYWLDCPVSTIGISSVGTPSPSSVLVTCKMGIRGNVQLCSLYYLAARKYNGSWSAHVSPVKSFELSVPAAAGYTQFTVRAYRTAADANAWNSNFVCEKGIGVAVDGATGADAAFMYDNGPWKSGTTYVWNDTRRDKVIHPFNGVYYNFLVKNKGTSVTVAPSSANGDSNWEAMNKLINIATDSLFADGANVANFLFKNGVLRSQDETDGVANIIMNGKTGYFHCSDADITGKIKATSGYFQNGTISNCVFNSLKSSDNSFVYDSSGLKISAAFSISANGFTLKMEKEYADFVIQNSNGQNLVKLAAFSDIPTVASPTLVLSHPNSGNGADLNATSLYLGKSNGEQVGLTTTSFGFRSNGKNYDGKTTDITVYDSNGNGSRMYFYNGILYDVKSV